MARRASKGASTLLRILLAVGLSIAAASADAAEPERVSVPSADNAKTSITAYLFRPSGPGPFPVVVALHGCNGLLNSKDEFGKREQDWTARFLDAGYAVLYPDSYRSRGFRSVCNERDRAINPAGRARDVAGAVAWLQTQSMISKDRIAVVGWSNGGSTALRFVATKDAASVTNVIAFYPGCTPLLRRDGWHAAVPLQILIGEADDWTPAQSCKELTASSAKNVNLIVYAGAYHDFDAPDSKVRVRKGRAAFSVSGTGQVHVGTNEPARQAAIKTVMQRLAEQLGRSSAPR